MSFLLEDKEVMFYFLDLVGEEFVFMIADFVVVVDLMVLSVLVQVDDIVDNLGDFADFLSERVELAVHVSRHCQYE